MNPDRSNPGVWARMLTIFLAMALILTALTGCSGPAQPPTVVITAPAAGATVEANVPLTIEGAVAGDTLPAANVQRIEVVVDGIPLANVPVPEQARSALRLPIVLQWTPTVAGAHFVQFIVYGPNDAVIIRSEAVVFNVVAPATPTPAPTAPPIPTATAAPADVSTVPTPIPSPTAEPAALTVIADLANVREGPSTNYRVLGQLQRGQTVAVKGKNADSTWWQIAYQNGDGWVFGELVQVSAAAQAVAVAQAPALPTAAPVTVAPTPAATPTASGPVCDETSPYWRGSNPNYPFCATKDPTWGDPEGDWNVYDNGKDIPLSISWAMFGPNIQEVRIHFKQSNEACAFARPAQREIEQVVPATGTFYFNVLDFPYGGTFWVYFTVRLMDGRVVQWGQKKLCIR